MKKAFILFVVLLLAGCTAPKVELQEVTNDSVVVDLPEITEPTIQDIPPNYNFTEGESKEILGFTVKVVSIKQGPEVDLLIDGQEITVKDTKSEELSNGLSIWIQEVIYSYNEQNKLQKAVILKIEQYELGVNEYIITQDQRLTVRDKDIILEKSRSDGSIDVTVDDKGRNSGETEKIAHGESLEIYGVTITNIKNYYKSTQYALVSVE